MAQACAFPSPFSGSTSVLGFFAHYPARTRLLGFFRGNPTLADDKVVLSAGGLFPEARIATTSDRDLTCRCKHPANRNGWFEGPAVSECHLPRRLLRRNHSAASTEARTSDGSNFSLGLPIVLMHSNQHCPHRSKDVVRGSDCHGYAHRRRMCDERMLSVAGLDNYRCSDRLLPQVVANDPFLYSVHQLDAEVADDCEVNPPSINPKELAALTMQSNSSSSSNLPLTISTWDRPRNCCFQHSHNSRFGSTKVNLGMETDIGYRPYFLKVFR